MYLVDLPSEIIAVVLATLQLGPRRSRDISSVSLTCHDLRRHAIPFLFAELHLTVYNHELTNRSRWVLAGLQRACIEVLGRVRSITEHTVGDNDVVPRTWRVRALSSSSKHTRDEDDPVGEDDAPPVTDSDVMDRCNFQSLQRLRLACVNSPLLLLLKAVRSLPIRVVQMRLDRYSCIEAALTKYPDVLATKTLRPYQLSLDAVPLSPSRGEENFVYLNQLVTEYATEVTATPWHILSQVDSTVAQSVLSGHGLKELHIGLPACSLLVGEEQRRRVTGYSTTFSDAQALQYTECLERLSVSNAGNCERILRIASKLHNLQALRLDCLDENLYHRHIHNHDFEGLPYLNLPKLRSLDIRYVTKYLSIKHILPTQIEHFRIEYHSGQMSSYDMQWMSTHAPNLTCLELDVGSLDNLWNPTAVAGVDVEVEVYSRLHALTLFPQLRTLRLFPTYFSNTAQSRIFRQPLLDEQAIKIYQYLQNGSRRFQELFISISVHECFLNLRRSIHRQEPMKWWVCSSDTRIFLRTHQVGREYELEQIWEGQRRLTTQTLRFVHPRAHFDELDSRWLIPSRELFLSEHSCCRSDEFK